MKPSCYRRWNYCCFGPISCTTMDEEYDVIVLGTGLTVCGTVKQILYLCQKPWSLHEHFFFSSHHPTPIVKKSIHPHRKITLFYSFSFLVYAKTIQLLLRMVDPLVCVCNTLRRTWICVFRSSQFSEYQEQMYPGHSPSSWKWGKICSRCMYR